MKVQVAVLATDSNGAPSFFMTTIDCTHDQYDQGGHLEMAKEEAECAGYEAPMIAFDKSDAAGRELEALAVFMG